MDVGLKAHEHPQVLKVKLNQFQQQCQIYNTDT